jgi:hypothetical protein
VRPAASERVAAAVRVAAEAVSRKSRRFRFFIAPRLSPMGREARHYLPWARQPRLFREEETDDCHSKRERESIAKAFDSN